MTTDSTNTLDRRVDDKRASGPLQWDGEAPADTAPLREAMIDTETLGTTPGSAILSIGAVMFGPAGLGESFYAPILLSSCTGAGLTIDPNTIAWWMSQGDEARAAAFPQDAAPLHQVLFAFANWFERQGAERPWCHGATFDVPLLDAAYKACGIAPPWKFWNVRDTRTLYDVAGVKPDRSKGTHHNALDDAINQAEAAVMALRLLSDRVARPAFAAQAEQSQPPVPRVGGILNLVGCENGEGFPNIHTETETCEVCAANQSQAAQPTDDDQWIFDLAAKHESPSGTLYGPVTFSSTALADFVRDVAAHIAGTSQATKAQAEPDLHGAIMNLSCRRTMSHFATQHEMSAYKEGHLDARCAAAELALAAPVAKEAQPLIGKLMDEISRLPVLWGLNEPGALLRNSDVFRVLVGSSKSIAKEAEKEQQATERALDLYDEIECDLPSLFGRASNEGHEAGQRLAEEVRAKMQCARAAGQSTLLSEILALAKQGMCHGLLADDYCSQIVAKITDVAPTTSTVSTWFDSAMDTGIMPASAAHAATKQDKE